MVEYSFNKLPRALGGSKVPLNRVSFQSEDLNGNDVCASELSDESVRGEKTNAN